MTQRILAIIPARGGSKRLSGKNLRPLAGRPLLAYSILTARATKQVGKVVVSSDDNDILQTAAEWGAVPIRRPDALASDTASTVTAMQHALAKASHSGFRADHVALFQATCPLRRVAEIEKAIDEYLATAADSALTVNELHLKAGTRSKEGWYVPQYEVGVRKQDLEPIYQENGAFYITRADLIARGILIGPRTRIIQMAPESGLASIDTEFDFQLTEALYQRLDYEAEFAALIEQQQRKVA